MTAITYRDGIAIAQLVFYAFSLFTAIYLGLRHGFKRSSGWVNLILLSVVRILGSVLQLATISAPTNKSLYIGAAVLQNIGIAPLQLAALGLLSRALSGLSQDRGSSVINRGIKFLMLAIGFALILSTVGGSQTGTDTAHPSDISKASVIIFLATLVTLVAIVIVMPKQRAVLGRDHQRIVLVVGFALPFILVRIIYSVISIFSGSPTFRTVTGNSTIYLCMSVIEEWIVVFVFECLGLTLPRIAPPAQRTIEEQPMQSQGSNRNVKGQHREPDHLWDRA